jgi:GT2 family glycosyltransferase
MCYYTAREIPALYALNSPDTGHSHFSEANSKLMAQIPTVSFVVVNYNGLAFLRQSLPAIKRQNCNLPYEILLVDNGSTDGSLEFVRDCYPSVVILPQERNLGFAGGCQVGFEASKGEFLAIVNNDAVIAPNWLQTATSVLTEDNVGSVASHTVLYYRYTDLVLHFPVSVSKVNLAPCNLDFAAPVFSASQKDRSVWHCQVPVKDHSIAIEMTIQPPFTGDVLMQIGDESSVLKLEGNDGCRVQAKVKQEGTFQLIQNTGLLLLPDGSGRDRGTYVSSQGLFYLKDKPLRNQPVEVFGACGVAVLYRRKALDEVGFYDPWYFAYYEDLDLAWRMRLHGWRAIHQPQARVRHVHCGTSKEWSPLFRYYTQRNRLATIIRNGWPTLALYILAREFINNLIDAAKYRRFSLYWRIWRDLALRLPQLLRARSTVPSWHKEEILQWMKKAQSEGERKEFKKPSE